MGRGKRIENAMLGAKSWFRCGGHADHFYEPVDLDDLGEFLSNMDVADPLTIVGGMANTIVRDGGVRGNVLCLGKAFAGVNAEDNILVIQGGTLNGSVAAGALKNNIGGLEFLSGIPGTIGGALKMNAGAYGTEMKDVLVNATAMSRLGEKIILNPADLNMTYRHTSLPDDYIIVEVRLKGKCETYEQVKERLNEIKRRRNETQPIREKTGGSTFANPTLQELEAVGLPEGTRAWELVDRVGGRGFTIGGAKISEKHCNFMINTGNATGNELEDLGDEMRRRVYDLYGIQLRWEIKRIGEK